ncbi:MAG: holo-ACP synthase [Hydrogenophilales bacterium CG17_big_fil_post_rev_8_21_14_2_50_63_12]|nr:MAG: holo-ACP synthase [Hydrogenophilales bacterium CG17_big_fil_post_rev_8_21_14_2_50_63_12]PIX98040.1 MAG: holo-ACP synthase [Hydrogenophilales bacterium CG_4_10_14_3_um_filter_63_21]PJB04641.1 MAG: holo-ACP synthase [Hydrogenophilales bacterium CG_4_9_14_3_um_filter_63_34]
MIYGIGTDIAGIRRMGEVHARYGGKLAQRLLSPEEWGEYAEARNKDVFLSKRFAAKEAFSKAVGTGMRAPVMLTAISVVHDPLGRPGLAFSPELAAWMRERGLGRVHLSISDERDHVVAFVLVEGR